MITIERIFNIINSNDADSVAIKCPNEDYATILLSRLHFMGVKWMSGEDIDSSHTIWNAYSEETVYYIQKGYSDETRNELFLCYGDIHHLEYDTDSYEISIDVFLQEGNVTIDDWKSLLDL